MKRKRIGTLTMAIVLIVSGVLMLISETMHISVLEYFKKFWPIILFLLGGEFLYFHFKYRDDEEIKITYDILSILIIIVIVGVNIFIYGFRETGFSEDFKNLGILNEKIYKIDNKVFEVGEEIEKIVIEDIEDMVLNIEIGDSSQLNVDGEVAITSIDEDEVENFVDEFVEVKESGRVLYLNFRNIESNSRIKNTYSGEMTITIPEREALEISRFDDVNINLTKLKEDIVLNDGKNVKVNVDNPIDYNVIAELKDKENFLGNSEWDISEIKDEDNNSLYFIGKSKVGESEHSIKVLNCIRIEVNKLKNTENL